MKLFKKIAIAAIGVVMALGVGIGSVKNVKNEYVAASYSGESPWSYSFVSGTVGTKAKPVELNNISWNLSAANYVNFDPNKGVQIGSGSKPQTTDWYMSASINEFGNDIGITKISVSLATASSGGIAWTFSAGDLSDGGTANELTSVTTKSVTFSQPQTSGDVKISLNSNGKSKAIYIKSVSVEFVANSATEHQISFDAGEGSGTMENETIKASTYVLPECTFTAPTGKEFDYWTIGGIGQGTHYFPGESIAITSDITIYANYKNCFAGDVFDFSQIDDFSSWGTSYEKHIVNYDKAVVTFNSANHSNETITDVPVTKGQNVYISTVKRPNLKISSLKWDFIQWTTKTQIITISYSTDGGENYVVAATESNSFSLEISSLPANVDTVRASFSSSSNQIGIASIMVNFSGELISNAYNVTYNANGATNGDVPVDDTNYNSGSEVTVLGNAGNLSKNGYSFAGWNTSPDGSGTSYSVGQTFNITDDIVLYAQWSKNTYSYKHVGTESDPFDVEDAYMKAIETGATATSDYYYIQGTITRFYQNPIHNGTTSPFIGDGEFEFEGFRLKDGRNGVNSPINFLNTETDLEVGAIITIYGKIKMYNGTTAETEEGGCVAAIQRTSSKIVSSIEISGSMSKTTYVVGDAWDYSGFKVIATYSDNTTADVTQFVTWSSNPESACDSSITSINITVSYSYADITKTAQCTQDVIVSEILDCYTFDLTIDQTVAHTDEKLSWESPYVSINLNKNKSSTKATNYYPGTSGRNYKSTRFYKDQLVTIIPVYGYKIDRLVFHAASEDYARTILNSSFENCTSALSGSLVTVNLNDKNSDASILIGGVCGFTAIDVYYSENVDNFFVSGFMNTNQLFIDDSGEFTVTVPEGATICYACCDSDWNIYSDESIISNGMATFEYITEKNVGSFDVTFYFCNENNYQDCQITKTIELISPDGLTDVFDLIDLSDFNTCDATGAQAFDLDDWDTLVELYDELPLEAKTILANAEFTVSGSGTSTVVKQELGTHYRVAKFVATYEFIVAKYGVDDFMNRGVQSSKRTILVADTSTTMVVSMVVILSISTLGGYFFLRKKKDIF